MRTEETEKKKAKVSLKTGFDMNPSEFIGITADVQQCFCSLVVHKEAESVFWEGGRERGVAPIIHSRLGHKVVATLVLVRGSICLILETERKRCYLGNKTPELTWVSFAAGAHPTCCPPTLDRLHVGCCSLPPRC